MESRPRVLLADADASSRQFIRSVLEGRYEVAIADDGNAALSLARLSLPDLVVADVTLPGLDGHGLLRELRAETRTRDLPVILLASSASDEGGGLDAGAEDYVRRPFSDSELLARVRLRLALSWSRQEIERLREQLQQARTEAEDATRSKDEFLATVSHELRTPLTAILGWAQMLRSGSLKVDRFPRAFETIERSARAQAQLIEDLLDANRILAGKLGLEPLPVDASLLVDAALASVRPAASAKRIDLVLTLASSGVVLGDPKRLEQVLWHLVNNAVKFTPPGGRVGVHVRSDESVVELTVTDSGQGIAPSFLPRVFDRFRQADGGTTRLKGGLGLGLAIARELVEMHGGTITAASDGVGKGARFTVRLPTTGAGTLVATSLPSDAPAVSTRDLDGLRVLVVEDEDDTREMLSLVLAASGASVDEAASASDGRRLFADARPDVVVSDIGMPGEDGYSFIASIRQLPFGEGRDVPAVALTAYARSEDRANALAAGFTIHMAKPVESGDLVALVASLARHTRVATTS